MKVEIIKSSDCEYSETREINTFEELLALQDEFGCNFIVDKVSDDAIVVEIYDDWRE